MYLSWVSLRLDFVNIFYLSPKFVRRRSNSLWWMSIFDVPFTLAMQRLCLHRLEGFPRFCAQRVVGAFFAGPKGPDSLPHVYELGSVGGGLALQCRLAVLFRLLEKDSLVAN
jgi:hypothetical protein